VKFWALFILKEEWYHGISKIDMLFIVLNPCSVLRSECNSTTLSFRLLFFDLKNDTTTILIGLGKWFHLYVWLAVKYALLFSP
jgi:hypothetical protein